MVFKIFVSVIVYSPSSSTIITSAWSWLSTVTLLGSEGGSMAIVKFLLLSDRLLSNIGISNEALVIPAENSTIYGVEP